MGTGDRKTHARPGLWSSFRTLPDLKVRPTYLAGPEGPAYAPCRT
jgi:hypothetical protein